jgi:hypothetical protein
MRRSSSPRFVRRRAQRGAVAPTAASERRRGTASVEAVMLLPLLTILFAGVFYMSSLYNTRQQALVTVRGCAWAYSKRACGGTTGLDERCVVGNVRTLDTGGAETLGGRIDSILSAAENIPVLGTLVEELFGRTFAMSVSTQVPSGPFRPGEPTGVRGGYYTLCNTEERTPGQVAIDIFCDFIGDLLPGC